MKYLSIDYGTKRIGLAQSDISGSIAFPYKILENKGKYTILEIVKVVKDLKIDKIIIGESLDKNNNPNPVYFKAKEFARELSNLLILNNIKSQYNDNLDVEICWQKEWYSSVEARNTPIILTRSGNKKVLSYKDKHIDHKAASIILQDFLNKIKK